MDIYVVQQGDTVYKIARNFGVSESDIIYINQLVIPYNLVTGQALLIVNQNEYRVTDHIINGYAYPFIQSEVLKETLSYLTELSIFSYGFTEEGNLLPPQIDPDWMLYEAKEQGIPLILTLTPFGEDGRFNNNLIHLMVTTPEIKETLISEVVSLCLEKGYAGADIDFEYILAEDREAFAQFVADMTSRLNENGLTGSVALAPKTSATQKGLLYEGKDYKLLGEAANRVLLMTYEWGYT